MIVPCPVSLQRLGRRLFWACPELYRWFGILRDRGDCLQADCDVWVGSYPRSANTFLAAAFRQSNPFAKVAMHWHIPAFIIGALRKRKPGFFLMRNPFDCVASWTIFWEGKIGLTDALDYYLDFHQALMPFRDELFIVTFEEAVTQFPGVLRRFNHRFSTGYLAAPPSEIFFNRCIADVENSFREADGSVNEFSVARPSAVRSNLKIALAEEVCSSKTMRRKLDQAEALWRHFRGAGGGSVRPALFSQRLSLDLQDR